MEIWKDIKGYEGLYQISNLGRVKVLPRKRKNGTNFYIQKERIIKPQLKDGRYYGIGLHKNGKLKNFLIHRLVAEAFLPNTHNYKQVNHIDANKHNNRADNLEWCSQEQNLYHALVNGLLTKGKKAHDTTLFDYSKFNV